MDRQACTCDTVLVKRRETTASRQTVTRWMGGEEVKTTENKIHGAALLRWCGVTQLVERRLAVRQARVRFRLSHWADQRWRYGERPRGMATDYCIVWMWLNECMYIVKIQKNKHKEWHRATKPLNKIHCPPGYTFCWDLLFLLFADVVSSVHPITVLIKRSKLTHDKYRETIYLKYNNSVSPSMT
jgi:hypothetical protein